MTTAASEGAKTWSDGRLHAEMAKTKQRIVDEKAYLDLLRKEAARRGWAGYVSVRQQFG